MILSGIAIGEAVHRGDIEVDPFDISQLNPVSYDLTLGEHVMVHDFPYPHDGPHDVRDQPKRFRHAAIGEHGFVIHPGRGYLMHTRERVKTDRYVPVIDGKSSLARLFVSIHQTAGFGDPGFDGQYTLEVTCMFPVRLRAGMRIAQMRFHEISGPVQTYEGNYRGAAAEGPVPSMAWKQFR